MDRTRALILVLAVAVSATAGVFALSRTLTLGSQARATNEAKIVKRARQLDRYQASLAAALSRRPPSLPPVPKSTSVGAPPAVAATVVYRRLASVAPAGASHHFDDQGERADD
jgi:hypothetical protein